jgi:phage repressor protein C with HTH and peptisase S24 domain
MAMAPVLTQSAQYSVLTLSLPQSESITIGILLFDSSRDQLYLRLRRDWKQIAPEDVVPVMEALEADLTQKSRESGAAKLFESLEGSLSNALQISDRRDTMVEDFDRALNRLYRQHVQSTVEPYRTHLPHYSLAVAAGPFLENREIDETAEDWVEVPPGLRLSEGMFVARIQGRSMEPQIPDGSLCIFRRNVTGSREGRLVLVEALGRGENDRYTVKRYHSNKIQDTSGAWSHQQIRLLPLNPEFEAWDLDPEEDRYRILAEFVQVLD